MENTLNTLLLNSKSGIVTKAWLNSFQNIHRYLGSVLHSKNKEHSIKNNSLLFHGTVANSVESLKKMIYIMYVNVKHLEDSLFSRFHHKHLPYKKKKESPYAFTRYLSRFFIDSFLFRAVKIFRLILLA